MAEELMKNAVVTNNVGHVTVNGDLDSDTYQRIAGEILALQNAGVSRILLELNSPGGDVVGIDMVLQALKDSPIPIETLITGLCASSAYWIASQTSRIIAMGSNVLIGSIGVFSSMLSTESYMKNLGIDEWVVVSEGSPKKIPQTKEEFIAQEQPVVNEIFNNFVQSVATGRRISVDDVLQNFGEGSLLTSRQALEVGMIDEIFQKEKKQNIIEPPNPEVVNPEPLKAKMDPNFRYSKILHLEPQVPARWREKSEVGLTAKIETHQQLGTHFYDDFRKKLTARSGERKIGIL